jgi:hypothetical protein
MTLAAPTRFSLVVWSNSWDMSTACAHRRAL